MTGETLRRSGPVSGGIFAVLLVVTGPSVITMLLLPIWVATVAVFTRRQRRPPAT